MKKHIGTIGTKKMKKMKFNRTARAFQIPSFDKDIEASIDVAAIRHNLDYLTKQAGTTIMPVLKADAYGHGLVDMAKTLRSMGTKYIGVATLGEAILLRESGDRGRVLAWLYDISGDEFKDALNLDIDIAIFDETHIQKIEKMIPRGTKINITIFVDTGINRASIPYDKAYQAAIDIHASDKFNLVGMMSHLVCSQIKNSPIVNEQLKKFRDLRKRLEEINIRPPLVHIANTGACLNYDVSDFTLARSGSGIYGLGDKDQVHKHLKLVMTVTSYVIQLKDVQKGTGLGYDWKYKAPKNMRVAIVPIGYADIVPRHASLKMTVYLNGTKRKVLGLISMDQMIIEAKENDKIHDTVYVFGNGKNCPQTIFDLGRLGNTIAVEILCHTGYRIARNRKFVNKTNNKTKQTIAVA